MYNRTQTLYQDELSKIHEASLEILKNTGVEFNDPGALGIFKRHGFKVDGKTVFMTEKDVAKALKNAPPRVRIVGRNPEKTVLIGGDEFVFAPTHGAPFVVTATGQQRLATFEDYCNCCKLIQNSKHIDLNGIMMVQPNDLPPQTSHLNRLFSNIVLCDKPFFGSTDSRLAVRDTIEMAAIVWGDKERLKEMPVTVSLINPLTPLRFSEEVSSALIEVAINGQAVVVSSHVVAGTTGPINLPGTLVLGNSEVLAGLILTQLVRPGAPFIYGGNSNAADMRTGLGVIGRPETVILSSSVAQIARFYNLPCRTGGCLTDAHFVDAQAGVESTLTLLIAIVNGSNLIMHSCGMMGYYISMNFEKFLVDEELCGMVRCLLKPIEINADSIDVEAIKRVGIGGEYLTEDKTYRLCRKEFHQADLFICQDYKTWAADGCRRIEDVAQSTLSKRLATYEKPKIEPEVERVLSEYVTKRMNGWLPALDS